MKKNLALLLALIMMLGAITACTNGGGKETDATESESSTETETDSAEKANLSLFPENAFPIFDGKTYAAKVVTSDTASSAERQVAATLRAELKSLTKQSLSASTDFLNAGEAYDSAAYEILVGQTKHEESQKVFNSISYNNYGIKV